MEDIQKRIADIEKEIRETPYHKGTEHHIGLLRARLAKLRDTLVDNQTRRRQGSGGSSGFALRKHGDATVVLVGFPSVGKSTLLNALTNAKSPTAEYAFTTVTVIPGMMQYKGANIQILDVPGLVEGASSGRGRGREVLSVVRSADLLLIIADFGNENELERIKQELYLSGVRLNVAKPNIQIKKLWHGGIRINSSVKQDLDLNTIEEICKEFRLVNAEINIAEKVTIDRLIDAFAKNRLFVLSIDLITKIDLEKNNKLASGILAISAEKSIGLDLLREAIWDKLGFVRVYLKEQNKEVDLIKPLLARRGDTLNNVLLQIGSEFAQSKKAAKIWGPSAHFPGQNVSLSSPVQDEMVVMFV